ncbi:alpha/beta hydrolase [Tuwongella immobilis]|uniref:Uncharacterized protein n=1 Tax=Tuwongella immobilis TaxID=692036 RepID=A0A6C2YQH7_9BACT|nr:alpha/beta hydrolase family protein [Tuwongella immobilis]VIP03142.1 Dienelactone hydrolase-like enzyme OS=Singulisphaera acidiphila (strain ATCC BAA-1392 / DSM 18658 / VKM B-2454 / MOB10) GN=Sinac_0389 PE=4 SV=1: AXE1: Abhydrolase_6 [Tuwongella immobilis]VTS03514.1 Dienelactone hydrolase-like enzyme OS=Singulisphaera acidiphila (strain ATCC BAA-1392 / DSM 18658 / VKM B-2454 / MOB10) GN=Sinac_0389 PE=4 SV=1: AXE1: Abhydrolase_6 [Tuwongella immobilis]
MPPVLPNPAPDALTQFMVAAAAQRRANDRPPRTQAELAEQRTQLRQQIFASIGEYPETHVPLQAKIVEELPRTDYRIEKLLFQTRPDVWVTATAYVPNNLGSRKVPAVLAVHGHWPWARRDPVVQARCLGLVKLGFFVLAIDATGAGERHTAPGRGTYHGALYGATLWPSGQSLLGVQVYDNFRAVEYLKSRPEVDGTKLGITGASGGGNQSMNAGALIEDFRCVVPVCSVGNYQAYLRAACCVCEVMPNALRFTEEGAILGLLTAPRHLMVINATRDANQFSPVEAKKSVAFAQSVYDLLGAGNHLAHRIFESGHDYSQPMREAMYGWMTLALKNEGKGDPIPEPKFEVETPETLAIFNGPKRPVVTRMLPEVASQLGQAEVAKRNTLAPTHAQQWEATAIMQRNALQPVLGLPRELPKPIAELGKRETEGGFVRIPGILQGEAGPIPFRMMGLSNRLGTGAPVLALSLEGKEAALASPLVQQYAKAGHLILAPDLRGIGETASRSDAIAGAPDHNSAEHAIWLGYPLLGQWVTDVQTILKWMAIQPNPMAQLTLLGIGHASMIALTVAALDPALPGQVVVQQPMTSWVTPTAYPSGTPMGVLVPGILRVADVPHLAAMIAPRPLTIVDGITASGVRLGLDALTAAFQFTQTVYRVMAVEKRLRIRWRPNLLNLVQGE